MWFLNFSFLNNRKHYSVYEAVRRIAPPDGSGIQEYRKYRVGEQVQRRYQADKKGFDLRCKFVPLKSQFLAIVLFF